MFLSTILPIFVGLGLFGGFLGVIYALGAIYYAIRGELCWTECSDKMAAGAGIIIATAVIILSIVLSYMLGLVILRDGFGCRI